MPRRKLPPEIRDYFVRMGKQGGMLGGRLRAENMTPEQRSESARRAVTARWTKVDEERRKNAVRVNAPKTTKLGRTKTEE